MTAFSDFFAYSCFYKDKCKENLTLQNYWDGCTSLYLKNNYRVFQAGLHSADFKTHLETLHTRHWQKGSKNVLDAGCGVGEVSKYFAEQNPDVSFTGLNISPEQIEEAKKDNPNNINFVLGSYDKMPFEDESFDFIYFYQSIGYRPLLGTLEEVKRVLKPGGKLLISDMCAVEDPDPQQARWIQYVQDIWHYMCYPVWYHLETASFFDFKLIDCNPNLNPILDFEPWTDLVDNGLGEYHNCQVPFSPIKVSEFLYTKE
jgi:ubiquinone/menaquinone biosynthesis C-methylase UbiE